MRTPLLALAAAFGLTACGGAAKRTIDEQQVQLTALRSEKNSMLSDLKDKDAKIAALDAEKAELDGRAKELSEKAAAAQAQIESLQQSNAALTKSLDASKGEMAGQLSEAIAEKDKLAKRLNDLAKEKSAVERQRASASAKLAAAVLAAEAQAKRLEAADAAAKADAARAQSERSARLAAAREDLGKLADAVLKELESELVAAEQKGETLELALREPALFEPQKAKLTEKGAALLDRVAEALRGLPRRPLRVEGHTDNAKIKWELFGSFTSHWDLAAARAAAVARHLHEHGGLDPRLMTVSGFGEFRPVKANDTPEGRAANKRVVLVVEPATKP